MTVRQFNSHHQRSPTMVDGSNEGGHEHEDAAESDAFVGSIDRQLAVLRMGDETMSDGSGDDPADAYIYRPVSCLSRLSRNRVECVFPTLLPHPPPFSTLDHFCPSLFTAECSNTHASCTAWHRSHEPASVHASGTVERRQ